MMAFHHNCMPQLGEYFVTKIETVQRQIDADFTDLTVSEAFISVGNTSKVNSKT